jgi:hypothetical protein
VLASYNGAIYIKSQLNSLLENLSEKDEIIVSDDASTDATRSVVNSIQDNRIILLPQGMRLGYQGNFQRAISFSSGQYIFFSDQDDICLPERVPLSLEALRHHSCVFSDAKVVDQSLNILGNSYFAIRNPIGFGAVGLFLRPSAIGATIACSRDFIEHALPFPKGVAHDHWLSVLAAARGELTVCSNPFILYRRHSSAVSSTTARSRRSINEILVERILLAFSVVKRIIYRKV